MIEALNFMKVSRVVGFGLLAGTVAILSACSSGSSDNVNAPMTATFELPTTSESLKLAVTTRFTGQQDFDVWLCSIDGANPTFAYSLNANNQGIEYDLLNNYAQGSFIWEATSFNSITTTINNGTQNSLDNIQFNDIGSRFTSTLNQTAEFACDLRTQEAVGISPSIMPSVTFGDNGDSNSLSYGGQSYLLTHGFEESYRFRPEQGNDTHRSSQYNVADGEFFSTEIVGILVSTQVWRPRSATVWLRADLHSPGPDDFTSATFEFESNDTDEDGPLVSGRYFFQDGSLGVDINGDGDIESDDGEFLDITAGSISVAKTNEITSMSFDVMLENGVPVTGSFSADFITITVGTGI